MSILFSSVKLIRNVAIFAHPAKKVNAGDAAYKLASRLNLTAEESGQLGRCIFIDGRKQPAVAHESTTRTVGIRV